MLSLLVIPAHATKRCRVRIPPHLRCACARPTGFPARGWGASRPLRVGLPSAGSGQAHEGQGLSHMPRAPPRWRSRRAAARRERTAESTCRWCSRPNRERENLLGERTRIVNGVECALCTAWLHVPVSQVMIASAQNEPKEDFKDPAPP